MPVPQNTCGETGTGLRVYTHNAYNSHGILSTQHLPTARDHILTFWQQARYQGRIAALNHLAGEALILSVLQRQPGVTHNS